MIRGANEVFMKRNQIVRCLVSSAVLAIGALVGGAQQRHALPVVSFAEVPLYPPIARAANISGTLHVVVTTNGRGVLSAHAQGGNKFLRDAAEKNAMSWRFTTHEPTTFVATYVYKLVDDLESQPDNSRVILRFPDNVEVDAQHLPGTHDMPISQTNGAASSEPRDPSLLHEAGHADPPKQQ
jgi:hypothetical protein